jgi:hypothetical protein
MEVSNSILQQVQLMRIFIGLKNRYLKLGSCMLSTDKIAVEVLEASNTEMILDTPKERLQVVGFQIFDSITLSIARRSSQVKVPNLSFGTANE